MAFSAASRKRVQASPILIMGNFPILTKSRVCEGGIYSNSADFSGTGECKPRVHVGGRVTSRWADFFPTEVIPVRVGWDEIVPAKKGAA